MTSLAIALLGSTVAAQQAPESQASNETMRLDAVDHAERLARIALTGDLGFPLLPPVMLGSPSNSLLYADRFPVAEGDDTSGAPEGTPVVESGWIVPGPSGTGTDIGELYRYQLPVGYDPFGPPVPMVIAYHGYGASASSVHAQTTIDEEANARGWIYLAPTGMDDQLFGTPPSQQNVEALIRHMLDTYNVDPERIYMVGFSLGGGIAANFVARHRDPDDMMIAALGVVSGTYDWEQAYNQGDPTLQALMENPYNFGGPPFQQPFRYHQASDLRFLPSSYPPLPGTLDPAESMGTNLGSTPTYVVWDENDPIADVTRQGPIFVGMLQALGATLDHHTVTGTVNPGNGLPAPHSWAVLDEVDLFDFFEGKTADRKPAEFSAQLDRSMGVSWLQLQQRFENMFSYADGTADTGAGDLVLDEVSNATFVRADMSEAGITGQGPFDVYAESANAGNFQLQLTGFECPPAYMLDATTGLLHTGTESDPLTGTLIKHVKGTTPVDLTVVCDPTWTTSLTTTPNPATLGGSITVAFDAPDTSVLAWVVVGFTEALTVVKGHTVAVQLDPPALLVPISLGPDGDLSFLANIPATGGLAGSSILLQALCIDGDFGIDSISNLWVLKFY
jgi:pimeloyl-ACP methyl ester carboxylesterase